MDIAHITNVFFMFLINRGVQFEQLSYVLFTCISIHKVPCTDQLWLKVGGWDVKLVLVSTFPYGFNNLVISCSTPVLPLGACTPLVWILDTVNEAPGVLTRVSVLLKSCY